VAPEEREVVEKEFVEDMCEYVKKYNSVSKDYYSLKAKVLGLKKLKYHERGLSFEKGESKFDLKKSIDIVKNVFNTIDPKFEGILHKFLDGNIDSESKKGKSGGAYCINVAKSLPTFILLNHHDKLQDLLTIAHEAGHGINSEMMKESQNSLYFSTPPATAEIASTFFEDMVVDNLIDNSKGVKKLNILLKKIDMDVSSIFRQVAFFNFEREVHALFKVKHYLSKKEIGEVFTKHMISYMGSTVSQDKGSENWWMYVPHFRYYFYVYSYSMGLMIAKYMKAKYKKDKKYLANIKEFLSTGTSLPTSEVIKKLTGEKDHIWKMAIDEIKSNIDEADKLFKEINGSQL
jgi:oligoendopeptidase F